MHVVLTEVTNLAGKKPRFGNEVQGKGHLGLDQPNFRKIRSKTECRLVRSNQKSFKKNSLPFEVNEFSAFLRWTGSIED